MRIILIGILLSICLVVKGQSIIGEYNSRNRSHTNTNHYEQLILNADSTFSYSTRMGFIKINKEGKWSIVGDTLVLNEDNPCCKEKMIVKEKCSKILSKGKVRFSVTSHSGDPINYHLVVSDRDSTQTIWSMTGTTEVRIKKLKKFHFIVNSLLYSPEYTVRSSKSNEFEVRLAPTRFFYNEKWLIRNGVIVPIGWNNEYANYYLDKKD